MLTFQVLEHQTDQYGGYIEVPPNHPLVVFLTNPFPKRTFEDFIGVCEKLLNYTPDPMPEIYTFSKDDKEFYAKRTKQQTYNYIASVLTKNLAPKYGPRLIVMINEIKSPDIT
jgi:hypothetical protein